LLVLAQTLPPGWIVEIASREVGYSFKKDGLSVFVNLDNLRLRKRKIDPTKLISPNCTLNGRCHTMCDSEFNSVVEAIVTILGGYSWVKVTPMLNEKGGRDNGIIIENKLL
jgi:hypothetical protein